MKYTVYLTINTKSKINGINKIYVGVHQVRSLDDPNFYLGCGVYSNQPSTYMYPKTPFQYAVKKYGTSAFVKTILYVFDTAEEAYNKEAEIVNTDFLKQSFVYNISLGGLFPDNYKTLYQFDKQGNLLKVWNKSIEAYNFYNIPDKRFRCAIDNKMYLLDCIWSFNSKVDYTEYIPFKNDIIYLYNKDGKLLTEFMSKKECGDYLDILPSSVNKAILNHNLIQKQYYISNKVFDTFIPKARRQFTCFTYYIYDKDCKLISKAEGKEAMKVLNMYSWIKFRDIFRYNNGWYKDYYISIDKEVDKLPPKKGNAIKVDVFSKTGEYIETLDTIKEVKEKYKVPNNKLKNIELGNRYFGDYIFKYNSKHLK